MNKHLSSPFQAWTQTDGNVYRQRRFAEFVKLLENVKGGARANDLIHILDLGGTTEYWEALRPQWMKYNLRITILNVTRKSSIVPSTYTMMQGDATCVNCGPNTFDIVHSNSVIEHVGDWSRILEMASEVRRLAPHYFIQTPAFCFPIEPHYRVPFFHWLPEHIRAAILVRQDGSVYNIAMKRIQDIHILTKRQMMRLFPDAQILPERIGPLVKSWVAIK